MKQEDRDGTLHLVDGNHVLRFERRLVHSRNQVWSALTIPEEQKAWMPVWMDGELKRGSAVRLVPREKGAPQNPGVITELIDLKLLSYALGPTIMRWELLPDPKGTLLTLTHIFTEKAMAADFASAWHASLDLLELKLNGAPDPDSYKQRGGALHPGYVKRFS